MFRIARRQAFSIPQLPVGGEAPDGARPQPGHFVMLRLDEGGERIPLTVAD